MLKNLRVVVIVDSTSGAKCRTVKRMNICPTELHTPYTRQYYDSTSEARRYQQADAVFEEETQPGKKLLAEQRGHQRDHHAVDVEHDLQAEAGGFEARNDDVLLHAADAVHAKRKYKEEQTEVAVRGRAHLLFVAQKLEH